MSVDLDQATAALLALLALPALLIGSTGVEILLDSLIEDWHALLRAAPRLAAALVVVVVFAAAGRLVARVVARMLGRSSLAPTHRDFFRNLTAWGFVLLGLIAALNLVGLRGLAAGLLAGGGLTAVALGFAFRGIGENLLAGLFLAFSRPFRVGDLIESEGLEGRVRAIELRNTHIRTADGRDIFIPNAQIFGSPLINFTIDGLRRGSFKVGIDTADDAAEARRLLLDVVAGVEGVLETPSPAVTMASLVPSYVELEVLFWVDTGRYGGGAATLAEVRTRVMEGCRAALRDAGFTLSSDVATNVALRRRDSSGPTREDEAEPTG